MFVRNWDNRSNVEVVLDDLVDLSHDQENYDEIKNDLQVAIFRLEEKLYWYKVLLSGMEEVKKEESWISERGKRMMKWIGKQEN